MFADTAGQALLRQYAAALSPIKWGWELRATSKKFRAAHGIDQGHPLFLAIQAIHGAHDRRVGGLSSPAMADEETNKVIQS